ncbi:EamA family transporter [Tateyamaria pelophila]|uniref:EamA family transporter n=1 Tax=Tateyamaria pelophila TaxID=328415 RepID=UPI001CBC662F|nr:hypothetical protein [Tateyamaria pelophila]
MTQIMFGFALTFSTAMIVIVADVALKVAADGNKPVLSLLVIAGCVLYALSALFWFYAVQHLTLAQAGVGYSMLTLIALAILGAVFFGETLQAREYAGLACALMSMVLMARLA